MVLIEVLELVVDMYGAFHGLRHLKNASLSDLHVIVSTTSALKVYATLGQCSFYLLSKPLTPSICIDFIL
jgi:hypothetical protein